MSQEQANGEGRACVELRGVNMTYRSRYGKTDVELEAIRDVTQQVRHGEFITIIGPSGCGKSTLLEIIGGLRKSSAGEIRLWGEKITGPHSKLAMVFQEESTFPWRTVMGNVEFGLELEGMPKRERRERSQQIIDLVGLNGFENRHPRELSGGMKQRVAIARALAKDPEALLMDEPFGSLDQQTRLFIGAELLRIWEETGKTIIFVTHDISESVYLADRVWVMSSRPSVIQEVVTVDIPRPRDAMTVTHPRFHELTNHLWDMLRDEAAKTLQVKG